MKFLPKGSIFSAADGLKCPSNAPAVMAISTQKVRLVTIFFKYNGLIFHSNKEIKDKRIVILNGKKLPSSLGWQAWPGGEY
jgi:hypothetical protein